MLANSKHSFSSVLIFFFLFEERLTPTFFPTKSVLSIQNFLTIIWLAIGCAGKFSIDL